ncbi:DUF1735 domain-containing protein [Dyadobacter psychrotolerans]|uniref:DUF1735 domain-containing protein n=1 Tax=Dyadobacter psychrotolerans TaxID=2541721 RepID=A0A4V2Z4G4_9BACT|nr:DUF1735 domain-containing protein [Dyadobacter psychrotolerans]TDE16498.1 DUF1735 domain-containing protein [Dyadobacter psychrotolerans]
MKNSFKIAGLALLTFAFTSCLKDDITLDPDKSTNVIEFKNPGSFLSPSGSKYSMYTKAFDLAPENDYPITVSYSGADVAPEDITVTLGIDTPAIAQYNEEQETEYELIPTTLYTLPATVVIPKGQRTAVVALKIKSANFDFSKAYVLPIQIKSVSSGIISGNFGTILLNLNAKNKYDGVYTVTGKMTDFVNPAFVGLYSTGRVLEYTLETISATQCVVVDYEYYGSPITPFWTGTGVSGFGSFAPVVEFDPATDKIVAVTNYFGQPAPANTRSAKLNPAGVNLYNPTAKTISISYWMIQPSAVAAPPSIRTAWEEVWKFEHSR